MNLESWSGDFSFWYDNWNQDLNYSSFIDGHDDDMLSDFWHDDHWDFNDLIPTLGEELTQYIIDHAPTITDNKDIILWNSQRRVNFR